MQYYKEERKPRGTIRYIYDCSVQKTMGKAKVVLPHIHEYYEILYCQAGAYTLVLNETPYELSPGYMALVDPMEIHSTHAKDPGLNQYLVIKFMPEVLYSSEQLIELKYFLSYIKGKGTHQKIFSPQQVQKGGIGKILEEIMCEYEEKEFGYEIALRADISRLFLWILRSWHQGRSENVPDESALMLLSSVLAFVDENYAQSISMHDAARAANMSYGTFSRFFSKLMGRGFASYLLAIRIKRAAFLLADTNKSVTDIAMETGFSTASYFIQRFQESHGMTPKRFRKWYVSSGSGLKSR